MVDERHTGAPSAPRRRDAADRDRRVWQQVDPPPVDLVDGVLAAIAAEDLEFELLTLVETERRPGRRTSLRLRRTGPTTGSWMLEYEGPDFASTSGSPRIEDRTRVDGWVVPASSRSPCGCAPTDQDEPLGERGRRVRPLRVPVGAAGLSRLTFLDESPARPEPRVTPPFWI